MLEGSRAETKAEGGMSDERQKELDEADARGASEQHTDSAGAGLTTRGPCDSVRAVPKAETGNGT